MFGKGSGHVWSFRSEKDLETLENSIIERFDVQTNSGTYIGHRWTSFENQNIHMA
jgi:hypothetical protein